MEIDASCLPCCQHFTGTGTEHTFPCCSGSVLPDQLFATFTGACGCLTGTFELQYNDAAREYQYIDNNSPCGATPPGNTCQLSIRLACPGTGCGGATDCRGIQLIVNILRVPGGPADGVGSFGASGAIGSNCAMAGCSCSPFNLTFPLQKFGLISGGAGVYCSSCNGDTFNCTVTQ